jgi:hypothetical protein
MQLGKEIDDLEISQQEIKGSYSLSRLAQL